jgi:hypothetical protein
VHTKPKNLPWIDPKPRKTFNEDDIEWIGKEKKKSCIPRMSKNRKARKFNYKGGKETIVPLYSRNYVNKEEKSRSRT